MEQDHLLRDLLLELHATGRIENYGRGKGGRICEVLVAIGVIQPRAEEEWRLTPKGVNLLAELM
jgi:hypothetical protein